MPAVDISGVSVVLRSLNSDVRSRPPIRSSYKRNRCARCCLRTIVRRAPADLPSDIPFCASTLSRMNTFINNSAPPNEATESQVVTHDAAIFVDLGSFGARFYARAAQTNGALSIVEHPIPPRTLAAPLHKHSREDEYSYVLEGMMGAQLGSEVVIAEPGSLVFKPREQWHTFWNAGDSPCRVLEIIAPGGFEEMFAEMAADPELLAGEGAAEMDARYGIEVDYNSIERLCHEHGLMFPM